MNKGEISKVIISLSDPFSIWLSKFVRKGHDVDVVKALELPFGCQIDG